MGSTSGRPGVEDRPLDGEVCAMSDESATLRVFIELTNRLLKKLSLEEALGLVADAALDVVPADNAFVRVFDPSGHKLLAAARSGAEPAAGPPPPSEVGKGLEGWVVEHRSAARIGDVANDDRVPPPGEGMRATGSTLVVPLVLGEKVVGVLGLASSKADAHTELHELMATLLANCVAPVIERARLERLTMTDSNTLAFNERYLLPRLKEEISRAQRYEHPLSVLVMDIDRFKRINEVHGTTAGDLVLQQFVDRIRATVRLSDVLVRKGEDEFVLIATNTPLEAALAAAERIRERLAAAPLLEDQHHTAITVTAAIGVASWDGAETADELEARARRALHEARELGRGQVKAALPDRAGDAGETGGTG